MNSSLRSFTHAAIVFGRELPGRIRLRLGAWFWGITCIVIVLASASGKLISISPVLLAVPSGLFALGAGAFCFGRPGLMTPHRVLTSVFAAFVSVMTATHLPLRAGFAGSEAALNLSAVEVASGTAQPKGWAGCYRLKGSKVDPDGTVYLWTGISKASRCGFIKSAATKIPGAQAEVDLGDGWRYVHLIDEPPH